MQAPSFTVWSSDNNLTIEATREPSVNMYSSYEDSAASFRASGFQSCGRDLETCYKELRSGFQALTALLIAYSGQLKETGVRFHRSGQMDHILMLCLGSIEKVATRISRD